MAVVLRVLLRSAHARQHVLFDHDPAGIVAPAKLINHCRKLHIAFAEFAKDAVLERGEIVPLFIAGALVDRRAASLEMHVPDALTMPAKSRQRITAAETIMTGIETK